MKRKAAYGALAILVGLAFVPGADLLVTGLFYSKTEWFYWRYAPPFEFVRKALPAIIIGSGIFCLLIGLANLWLKDDILGITWRKMVYLLSTVLLGPGLIVNLLFKDHWGRARPSTIVEFGGKLSYSPPFIFSDQCNDNCSFASGHAAIAFWTFALAMLLPPPWRYRAGWAAILFGLLIGLVRVIQGAHFYSDVVSAGIVTVGVALALRPIIRTDGAMQNRAV
jgi:lipid A 4'-phosphatase